MRPSVCMAEYVRDSVVASGCLSLVNFEEDLERDHQLLDVGKWEYGECIDTWEQTAKSAQETLPLTGNCTERTSETS